MNFLDQAFILTVLAGTLRASTPFLFAGLGELVNERAGVLNLGLEGLMLIGACVGVAAYIQTDIWVVSLLIAAVVTAIFGLLHTVCCQIYRTNQIVTGLAFVFLCQGITAILGVRLVGEPVFFTPPKPLGFLRSWPIIGDLLGSQDIMVFVAILSVFGMKYFLWKTHWGILLRACGENPSSARSLGIPVLHVQLIAGSFCGAFCGIGGAYLALFYAQQWQENMVGGRGWIALVLVIFAGWKPKKLLLGAWLFGGLTTLQLNLQSRGFEISQYLLAMVPFIATIAIYCLASQKINRSGDAMPESLGKHFMD